MKDTLSPSTLNFERYSLKGVSTAGVGTCITVPEWKVCMDVAQGLPFALPMRHFLISHLHQDHAAGIPYLISQKAMQSHPAPTFYFPPGTADKMERIMMIWSELEGHRYDYRFEELIPGARQALNDHLFVESFLTKHRVTSQGYTLFGKTKKLRKEFQNLERQDLMDLKSRGTEIHENIYLPKISFTGDTQIEFLDLSPQVVHSETLVMEVTYFDEKKNVESARTWGHTHFQEVLTRLSQIQSKNIVWIHTSARYTKSEIHNLISKFAPGEKDRIFIL